jgi:NADPH:quinone reductase-like Zn-dependent oxidoreductase
MRAAIYKSYGPPDVLQIVDLPKPTPKENEVLIKLHATTVTSGDARLRAFNLPPGFNQIGKFIFGAKAPRNQVLGTELSGVIEAVGQGVTNFKPGDEVIAFSDAKMGCYVEFKTFPETGAIAHKPKSLSHEQSAAICFGGTTALSFLRRSNITPGDRILINGASGGVGTAAIQLAKHFKAEITAVCSSPNHALVQSLGADHVIDYRTTKITELPDQFDIILDCIGSLNHQNTRSILHPKGRLLLIVVSFRDLLAAPLQSMGSGKKVIAAPVVTKPEDIQFLAELADQGEFTPVIDQTFPLDQIAAAHALVDSGRKIGNVIITF